MVVLTVLVFGMTLTSGLLLILEPGPVAPPAGPQLMNTSEIPSGSSQIFDTSTTLAPWQAIVIHDSASKSGSAETINRIHERANRGGLGYHFVINNGTRQPDGMIEVGFRWQRQFVGAYLDSSIDESGAANWFNRNAIGVCMIGNAEEGAFTDDQMRELAWLVRSLQERFNIPADRVFVAVGSSAEPNAPHFPYASFQQQLLQITDAQ